MVFKKQWCHWRLQLDDVTLKCIRCPYGTSNGQSKGVGDLVIKYPVLIECHNSLHLNQLHEMRLWLTI